MSTVDIKVADTTDATVQPSHAASRGSTMVEIPPDVMRSAMKKAKRLGMKEADVKMCWQGFHRYDSDSSGFISMAELRGLLEDANQTELTSEELEEITFQFDTNADGQVDFEEFLEAFCQMPEYRAANMEHMIESMAKETQFHMNEGQRNPEYKAYHGGVSAGSVLKWLEAELQLMESCMMFPWTVLMVCFFVLAVYFHERVEILFALDETIRYDITENANFAFAGITPFENGRMGHKNVYDVNSVADFYSWMNLGLVTVLFAESWDVSETRANTIAKCTTARQALKDFGLKGSALQSSSLDGMLFTGDCPESQANGLPEEPSGWYGTPRTPTYLMYNSVVGGVRLRQERTDTVECPKRHTYGASLHTGQCIGQGPAPTAWSPGYWLKPDSRASVVFDPELGDKPGGETIYLLSGQSQTEVRAQLRDLEDNVWMGPYTQKVELLIPTYNPHLDTFTTTYIVIFVNPAGHYWRRIYPVSFWLNPYHDWWGCYVFDCLWLILVFKMIMEEGRDLVKDWRESGFLAGSAQYFTLSNCVDWCNVAASCVIVAQWIRYNQNLEVLKGYLAEGVPGQTGTWADPETRVKFYEQLDVIVASTQLKTVLLAMYPFVVVARLFKSLSAQPRLALVTRTITAASTDLVHFGLVFFLVFVLFASSSMLLFGPTMAEFSTFARAIDSSFHVIFGDFDWEDIRDSSRVPAVVWFWSFTWLVQVVMFNMLLAIIMDVYTEVRGSIGGDKETLWHQTYMVIRRWWQTQRGERVRLSHIRKYLINTEGIDEETTLTVPGVMKVVPGLREDQAFRLITNTIERDESLNASSQTMAEAASDIMTVRSHVEGLRMGLAALAQLQGMSTSFIKSEIRKNQHRHPSEKRKTTKNDEVLAQVPSSSKEVEELRGQMEGVSKRCERMEQHLAAISLHLGAMAPGKPLSRV